MLGVGLVIGITFLDSAYSMFANEEVATKILDGECNDLSTEAGGNEPFFSAALVSLHATSKKQLAIIKKDASNENLEFERNKVFTVLVHC